jgi:hypothetical protein
VRARRPAPARPAPPLPPRISPGYAPWPPELASYDGAAHLQQGVALMITGLQSHFRPAPAPPPETAQHQCSCASSNSSAPPSPTG